MQLEAMLDTALRRARAVDPFDTVCIAVSGGGDSMALLHMAADWGRANDCAVTALTVDHGLRDASAGEAAMVARTCAGLGVAHDTLVWTRPETLSQNNLPAAARAARYDLIAGHVNANGPVLLAHTRDDVAETFLMRLARGSGVDGLARMKADWQDRGQRWLRPFLEVERAALRDWLSKRGIAWVEDPTNEDQSYERARVRAGLRDLGIDSTRIADTSARLASAREVLRRFAQDAARDICRTCAGDVIFDWSKWAGLPEETRFRLFAHALRWITSATYRPRQSSVVQALDELDNAGTTTLAGCLITLKKDEVRVTREYAAVRDLRVPLGEVWDGRWRLAPAKSLHDKGLEVAALGPEGLGQRPDWRDTGLPRTTLLSTPALWRGDTLVAAPLAGQLENASAELVHPWGDFFASLLSH